MAEALQTTFPHFRFLIGLTAIWRLLLLCCCRALSTYTLVVLFWQIAHELYTTNEASVAYPLFVRSISIIIASFTLEWLSLADHPLQTCTLLICTLGILMMGIVFLLDRIFASPLHHHGRRLCLPEKTHLTHRKPATNAYLSPDFTPWHLSFFGMLVN